MRVVQGLFVASMLMTLFTSAGCTTSSAGGGGTRIIRPEDKAAPMGGIPGDKQAEIQLVIQQHQTSTLKCYADVLNEKHDRSFQGTVKLVISFTTQGTASDVKVVGGTLHDQEVIGCLTEKLKSYEYPTLDHPGQMQYDFKFEPAY